MTENSKSRLSTLGNQDQLPRTAAAPDPLRPAEGAPSDKPSPIDVQAYIGRQLRAVYDDVAKQPVPDRFIDLMKQLEGLKPSD